MLSKRVADLKTLALESLRRLFVQNLYNKGSDNDDQLQFQLSILHLALAIFLRRDKYEEKHQSIVDKLTVTIMTHVIGRKVENPRDLLLK
jgi:hypothetical protein